MGSMNRRHFLQLGAAAATGMMLDPERLLWVPGAKTYFIPNKQLVTASTMAEALTMGLRARIPSGHGSWCDVELRLEGPNLADRMRRELDAVRAMGGHVVERRTYTAVGLKDAAYSAGGLNEATLTSELWVPRG